MSEGDFITVELMYCPDAYTLHEVCVRLPRTACLADALLAAGWALDDAQDASACVSTVQAADPGGVIGPFLGRLSLLRLQCADAAGDVTALAWSFGIWSRVRPLDAPLADGDRVEVYRALVADPKVARRERFAQQGSRAAGLFARRRPGSKAGY